MIPADLGPKLDKGMKIMDTIQDPVCASKLFLASFERDPDISHPLFLRTSAAGVAGEVLDAVLKRDLDEERFFERDVPELETRSFEDWEDLEERYFDEEEIEARSFEADDLDARSFEEENEFDARSFEEANEFDARSFEDADELEKRSWDFEEDYA